MVQWKYTEGGEEFTLESGGGFMEETGVGESTVLSGTRQHEMTEQGGSYVK